jgi:hypothetical protein
MLLSGLFRLNNCTTQTVTTNIQYVPKDGKATLKPKVALKWPHESGFTIEKLEFSPDVAMTVETSLVGAVPGLKLDYKGNDSDKSDLSLQYKSPGATFTADFDILNLSKAEVSISTGKGDFTGGLSALFSNNSADSKQIKVSAGLGVAYTAPKVGFAALRAKDNFTAYSLLLSYSSIPKLAIAGAVDYSPKTTLGTVVTSYSVDSSLTLKAKATTEGIFSASIKKSFEKKFAVVGSVEVPRTLKSFKWGLNATLG